MLTPGNDHLSSGSSEKPFGKFEDSLPKKGMRGNKEWQCSLKFFKCYFYICINCHILNSLGSVAVKTFNLFFRKLTAQEDVLMLSKAIGRGS